MKSNPRLSTKNLTANRAVRVFLSSTFRDFGEERDLLVRKVFPALRSKLKERFVEIVDVDLRWGITVQQAERGEVLPICLAEIDRARPFFVGMLGERYGWVPAADAYAADLIERQPWLNKHRGGKSVTELEILHGVLNNPKMAGRAFFYFRSAAYAKIKGGEYLPMSRDDAARQKALKARIRKTGFPVVQYRDPAAFAKRLERDLWKVLDEAFPVDSVPDAFEREGRKHEAYAAPRRRLYLGGERYLKLLDAGLARGGQRILIEGASGGGKSALLANWLQSHRKAHPQDLIHEHYLGASADAADPVALARRLIEAIWRTTQSSEAVPGDPQKLMESLPLWLANANAYAGKRKTRWAIVLDALNGLTDLQDLRWFPEFMPARIHLVISCLPGPVQDALKTKGQWKVIAVKPLAAIERRALLAAYLARYNKTLPKQLLGKALAHPLAANPLFLRTLGEELRLFGVHEEIEDRLGYYLQSRTVDGLFERVLERVEGDCGEKGVSTAMQAIWASRAGLTEEEILGITNLVPATWAPIRNALDEALLDSNGRLTFAHDYLRSGVKARYLYTPRKQRLAHAGVASWFAKTKMSPRRIEEETYQLRLAANWINLRSLLTNYDAFGMAMDSLPIEEFSLNWTELEKKRLWNAESNYERVWPSWSRHVSSRDLLSTSSSLSRFFEFSGRYGNFAEKLIKLRHEIYRRPRFASFRGELQAEIDLGELHRRRADYKTSSTIYNKLLLNPTLEKADISQRVELLSNLSELSISQGKVGAAKQYLEQALKIGVSVENFEWYSLAELDVQKAWLCFIEEKFMEGEKVLKKVISLVSHRRGRNDPLVSVALNNLALILYNHCKFREASEILEGLLTDDELSLGEKNFNTILDGINLGWAKEAQGDLSSSKRLYSRAWTGARDSLGPSHPSALLALSSLSWINLVMHGFESKGISQNALGQVEKYLGKSHADTITPRRTLVWSLISSNDLEGARKLASLNERISCDYFGRDHSQYAGCLFDCACVFEPKNKESYFLLNQALEVMLQSLGSSHLDVAIISNALGVSAAMRGSIKEAVNAFKRAASIQSTILPEMHNDRRVIQDNLRSARMLLIGRKGRKFSRFMAVRRYLPSSTM